MSSRGPVRPFRLSLLSLLTLLTVIAGPGPARAAEEVDFVSWVSGEVANMAGSGSEGYSGPTAGEITHFEAAVADFLDESWAAANTNAALVDYEVVALIDTGYADEILHVLRPASGNTDGQGLFFLRPAVAVCCDVVLAAPHPKYDTRTGVLSAEIFRMVGVRGLMIAGTHRCANATASGCDGTTTVCGGGSVPFRESDMAHVDNSFFQSFHELVGEEQPGSTKIIQIHGFGSGAGDPEFTISDGTTTDNVNPSYLSNAFTIDLESRVTDEGSTKGGNCCNRAGDDNMLCGTTNTQGRFTNGVAAADVCDTPAPGAGGRFIHVELSWDLRHSGGTLEPTLVRDSIEEVFSCRPSTLLASIDTVPSSGTLPFSCQFRVQLQNLTSQNRSAALHVDVTIGNGSHYTNWRAGSTNLSPDERFDATWNQSFLAYGSLIGNNIFELVTEDVTPVPYNQPPYLPAGDTDVDSATVTAFD